jgi:hypothetical protein
MLSRQIHIRSFPLNVAFELLYPLISPAMNVLK